MANDELATARIPADLKAHAVWASTGDSEYRRAVYITERARRKVSIVAMIILVPALGAVMIWGPSEVQYWAAIALVVGGLFAVRYQSTGRAGYYRLQDDGTLGDYLGRRSPDLSDMQRTRVS